LWETIDLNGNIDLPICIKFRGLRYPYWTERAEYNLNFARPALEKFRKPYNGLPNPLYINKFVPKWSNKYQYQTAGCSLNWQNIDG
jgi:hypothetical protein